MTTPGLIALLWVLPVTASGVPEVTPDALRDLAPLVGTRWMGHFPDGELTDEQVFEWAIGGRFLRNLHWVKDGDGGVVYEGETIYAWDPVAEELVWWYWNATGGYVTGTLTATADGFLAEGVNHAPAGQTPRVRGAFRNLSGESWESVQYFERDGEWVEQWTLVYRPVKKGGGAREEEPSDR